MPAKNLETLPIETEQDNSKNALRSKVLFCIVL